MWTGKFWTKRYWTSGYWSARDSSGVPVVDVPGYIARRFLSRGPVRHPLHQSIARMTVVADVQSAVRVQPAAVVTRASIGSMRQASEVLIDGVARGWRRPLIPIVVALSLSAASRRYPRPPIVLTRRQVGHDSIMIGVTHSGALWNAVDRDLVDLASALGMGEFGIEDVDVIELLLCDD